MICTLEEAEAVAESPSRTLKSPSWHAEDQKTGTQVLSLLDGQDLPEHDFAQGTTPRPRKAEVTVPFITNS